VTLHALQRWIHQNNDSLSNKYEQHNRTTEPKMTSFIHEDRKSEEQFPHLDIYIIEEKEQQRKPKINHKQIYQIVHNDITIESIH